MQPVQPSDFSVMTVLILTAIGAAIAVLLLTHLIGPKRKGQIKDSTYESGVDPIRDTRHRFNVRFYLVAVLFLVFDVEIVFLYPWAVLFPHVQDASNPATSVATFGDLANAGYTPMFFLVSIGIFFALLTVGFIYEWRKGIFQWDR